MGPNFLNVLVFGLIRALLGIFCSILVTKHFGASKLRINLNREVLLPFYNINKTL